MIRILRGDCREVMATLPEASVDSIVCDPPYELTAGKKGGSGAASVDLDSPYGRARIGAGNGAGGFMGQKWDATGVAHDVETWKQALRVLKPGGHLLAFSGTRTYHRMVCAIEDAGFEIRDSIGDIIAGDTRVRRFLSSLDDEQLRAFAQCIDESQFGGLLAWVYGSGFPKNRDFPKLDLSGEDAERWRGWGTALKPALEPIVLARKPLQGTVAANVQRFGTGALNIDGCRVAGDVPQVIQGGQRSSGGIMNATGGERGTLSQPHALGRWPANIIHDGSEEVLAAFPQTTSGTGAIRREKPGLFGLGGDGKANVEYGDSGSAARFFYTAKASRHDRNDGLRGMPKKAVNWSSGEQSPGTFRSPNTEREQANHHPTVKPTDLMRYLCRLITPPGGTVLDPFMGSGSTLKAAELEGFDAIGIELDPQYVEIARRRIASDAPLFAEVV